MSEIKVNKITPRVACGTTQLGDSGDTITIPSGATITNAGTASGFGATGETSWDTTVKTTGTFTATAGVGYFLNTTGGIITVNLPVGAAGSSVALADYAGTWQTSNVTVAANGTEKIGGVDADITLSTEGQSVTFVYIDGTQGWVNVLDSTSNVRATEFIIATGGCITTCGNCKMHTFLGPGTFTVCSTAPCAANNLVSYMVVASGGGGGGGPCGSGGASGAGAGGFRELSSPTAPYTASPLDGYPNAPNRITVTATGYPIVVGGGGAGGPLAVGPSVNNNGVDGNVSSFATIPSAGGGGGRGGPCTAQCGATGGSGGGATGGTPGCRAGGAGNTPPTTPNQGFPGGSAGAFPAPPSYWFDSAGGGGATSAGSNSQPGPRAGGAGATTEITTSPVTYGAGGNGGSYTPATTPISNAPDNSGTGGSGKSTGPCGSGALVGANGGSGIVVIRYKYQ